MGPNLTNITRVLSRIEEINRRLMPDIYNSPTAPMNSRFVDVLNPGIAQDSLIGST